MVKRFGENVTMADIESFAVNRTLEEMKEIARRKEQSLYKTIKTGQVMFVFSKYYRFLLICTCHTFNLPLIFSHQDKSKREKSKLSEKIKLNTTLMDKKTQLLDENATLEQRRKKDKVALDKVLILKQILLCSSHIS